MAVVAVVVVADVVVAVVVVVIVATSQMTSSLPLYSTIVNTNTNSPVSFGHAYIDKLLPLLFRYYSTVLTP